MSRTPRAILFVALLAAPHSLFAQKQPLSFETFLGMRMASDPQISPDGNTVAFSVSVPSLEANRNVSRIWIVPLRGGPARELTTGPGSDFAPRWAPDGSLGFISTRKDGAQVWRVSPSGGDPVQLTAVESGVSDFRFARDGKALFVSSDVKWPPNQEIDQRNGKFPTQAKIWTGLFYRSWDDWRVGTRSHLLRVELADRATRDLTPIDHDTPPLDLGGGLDLSPTGDQVALVYNPDVEVAVSTNNDVWTMQPDGTGMAQVTTRKGNDHSPAFSSDGKWIAYLSMETPGFEADRTQLMLYDRGARQHRSLTADWDVSVQGFAWLPSARGLVVEVEERGEHNLYQVSLAGGRPVRIVAGGFNSAPRVTPGGDAIVFLKQSATRPNELYTARVDGTGLKPLTNNPGYDAEATIRRDGKKIVFTSKRDGALALRASSCCCLACSLSATSCWLLRMLACAAFSPEAGSASGATSSPWTARGGATRSSAGRARARSRRPA